MTLLRTLQLAALAQAFAAVAGFTAGVITAFLPAPF